MFNTLPPTADDFRLWPWEQIAPYYADLRAREITDRHLYSWLADWSRLVDLIQESRWGLYVDTTLDTASEEAARRYARFYDEIFPRAQEAEFALKKKLLESEIQVEHFAIALRNIRGEASLFAEKNLPLLAEEQKLATEYEKVMGAQTVEWEGKEVTVKALEPVYHEPDRARREQAWRLAATRQLQDRHRLGGIWVKLLGLRDRIARQAKLPDYRAYRWIDMKRYDYRPEDCQTFHAAIEQVFVPAAARIYARRRQQLNLDTVRPWDTFVDPLNRPPLKPYQMVDELVDKTAAIFHQVDPALAAHFETMRKAGMLDLENRKGKGPGAYSLPYEARRMPFIFQNAVGLHDDVMTLLHEAGHAFHYMEMLGLPYHQQRNLDALTMEVGEVASMSMELLAAPYLPASQGGFYGDQDYARARVDHLEGIVTFLPYMAVVDSFQHWAYTHVAEAKNPARCEAVWSDLWDRYMVGIDYSGLEDVRATRWLRQIHIFSNPFYYVEYGMAQVGALQIWRNALHDQAAAVKQYRHMLSLGATRSIPDLYKAAGIEFRFDAPMLADLLALIERTMQEMEAM